MTAGAPTPAARTASVESTLRSVEPILRDPREARDLVAAVLDVPRHWPALNPGAVLDEGACERILDAARRRAAGAPFQYAVGRATFRMLTLEVDERVLIPRPETELLVETVLNHSGGRQGAVVDVGTGSGAIALSLSLEGDYSRIVATDISEDALAVARRNFELLGGRARAPVTFLNCNLLDAVDPGSMEVVVSNPPYVALREAAGLPREVRDWEPPVALFGGPEGMAVLRRLVLDAGRVLRGGGLLALEIDSRRAADTEALIEEAGFYYDVRIGNDLTGRPRFALATRREVEET
jgi:release factor glutamine methyltransferase